jgi:CheY-like chemotaxis protein
MTRLLQKLGHTVIPASTLTDALRLAQQHPVDLLLSDLSLPDGSGAQLLARLRSTHPHLPAIALSGHGSPDDLRRSKAAGFSDHLTKPLDIPELQRTLASLATTSALPNATALL